MKYSAARKVSRSTSFLHVGRGEVRWWGVAARNKDPQVLVRGEPITPVRSGAVGTTLDRNRHAGSVFTPRLLGRTSCRVPSALLRTPLASVHPQNERPQATDWDRGQYLVRTRRLGWTRRVLASWGFRIRGLFRWRE